MFHSKTKINTESCHFSGGGIIQLLIMLLLHEQSDYGYLIIQRIQEITGSVYSPESGTIYTLLRRLEKRGLLHSEWDTLNSNIDRRIYTLTNVGEEQLERGLKMITLRRPIFDYLLSYYDTHFLEKKV